MNGHEVRNTVKQQQKNTDKFKRPDPRNLLKLVPLTNK